MRPAAEAIGGLLLTAVAGAAMALCVGCAQAPTAGQQALTGQAARFADFRGALRSPAYRAPVMYCVPNVDGVRDRAYDAAEPVDLAFLTGKDKPPQAVTRAWVICTKDALHFFFDCAVVSPDGAACTRRTRDSDVWNDNCVEVFLDPTGTGAAKYYQVTVNPRGVLADAFGRDQKAWDPALSVATKVYPDRWTAEIAIPLTELGLTPGAVNKVWRMNLTRLSTAPSEDTSWIALGGYSSHVPGRFGHLWLDAGDVLNVAAQDMIPWRDLFKGRDLAGWRVRGAARVRDGMITTGDQAGATLVLNEPVGPDDFTVACDANFMGQVRFLFARDPENRQMGYLAAFINPINEINVAMMRSWEFYTNPFGFHGTIYKYTGGTIQDDTWYRLEARVRRDSLTLLVNGFPYLQMPNPYPDARRVGLAMTPNAKVRNVQIRRLVKDD